MGRPERVGVVTGASRGIGKATAIALAQGGVHVIGVARTPEALQSVSAAIADFDGIFEPAALDLAQSDAAATLAGIVARNFDRLDILVGNAAVLGPLTPVTAVSRTEFERVLATNLLANASLLAAFDPLLRRSAAGRALFMTAGAPREPFPNLSAYAASKAALEALVKTYALERQGTAVQANLFNPGPVRTDMRAEAVPNDDAEHLPTPEELIPELLRLLSPDYQGTGMIFDFPMRKLI